MIRFLFGAWSRIKLIGAAILAAALAIAAIYAKGRSDQAHKGKVRDLESYKKTTERIQDAQADLGDDPAVLREWLRERDPDQR